MPTLAELLRLEPILEAAARADLVAQGVVPVYSRFDTGVEAPPERIVVEASGFEQAGEQMAFTADGHPFHNHFRGQLSFTITTRRTEAGAPALHAEWLGLVRARMSRPAQALSGLAGLEVLRVAATSATVTYVQDGERDRSELVYEVEVGIPGDAVTIAPPAP